MNDIYRSAMQEVKRTGTLSAALILIIALLANSCEINTIDYKLMRLNMMPVLNASKLLLNLAM